MSEGAPHQIAEQYRQEHWRLDKRVPLAFVGFIFIQTIALVWYLSSAITGLDSRLQAIEGTRYTAERGSVSEANIARNRDDIRALEARTVRSLDEIKNLLGRIENKLDRTGEH